MIQEITEIFGECDDLFKNANWDLLRGTLKSDAWQELLRTRRLIERLHRTCGADPAPGARPPGPKSLTATYFPGSLRSPENRAATVVWGTRNRDG